MRQLTSRQTTRIMFFLPVRRGYPYRRLSYFHQPTTKQDQLCNTSLLFKYIIFLFISFELGRNNGISKVFPSPRFTVLYSIYVSLETDSFEIINF